MILILIRHGKTAANEKRLYCGKTDVGLSEAGLRALKNEHTADWNVDPAAMRVITSGMKRCEQTLGVLFGPVPHETDPAFCEMDFGAFEMRSYEELKNDPAYLAWISGDNESKAVPGGESGRIMQARVSEGLDRLIASDRDTLLITHGGVVAAIMARLFPKESKNRYEWQPDAGKGYRIDLSKGSYQPLL